MNEPPWCLICGEREHREETCPQAAAYQEYVDEVTEAIDRRETFEGVDLG